MSNFPNSLPADVLEALEQNNVIEAIKRLRQTTGLGLKQAKDMIDAHQRGTKMAVAIAQRLGPLPPTVIDALQRGNKIEAIKLLRESDGLGLKEAKDAIDAMGALPAAGPMAPGEVPRSGNFTWAIVVAVAVLVAGYYFLRSAS